MPLPVAKQQQADDVSERGERVGGELPEEKEREIRMLTIVKINLRRAKTKKKKMNLRRAGSARWGRRSARLLSSFSSGLSLFFSS